MADRAVILEVKIDRESFCTAWISSAASTRCTAAKTLRSTENPDNSSTEVSVKDP
jgi:hypothetical protein